MRIPKKDMIHLLKTRQIPARKIRGRWRISRKAIEKFLTDPEPLLIKKKRKARKLSRREARRIIGGQGSRPATKNEVDALIKQEEIDETLIEYLSLRSRGILLRPNQLQIEAFATYSHNSFLSLNLVNSELDTTSAGLALRYGLFEDTQLSMSGSYIYRENELTSGGKKRTFDNNGVGDLSFRIQHQPIKEADHGFDLVPFLGAIVPTDPGPKEAFTNKPRLGGGQYGITGGFSIIKPEDPAVIFLSYSNTYFFPESVAGHGELGSLLTLGYGVGFSLAMNDDFAPFISVSGAVDLGGQDIKRNKFPDTEAEFNVVSLRMGFDYRVVKGLIVEPSVSFGLTEDAADVQFSVNIPYTK